MKTNLLKLFWTVFFSALFVSDGWSWRLPKPSDSWDQIRSDLNVEILQTPLADAFGPLGFFNACKKENSFHTIKPLITCARKFHPNFGNDNGVVDSNCAQTQKVHSSIPQLKEERICLKWGSKANRGEIQPRCLEYRSVRIEITDSPEFHLFYVRNPSDGAEGTGTVVTKQSLFSKKFQIPDCRP